MQARSLFRSSTGLCADSVESPPGIGGVFALATYQVDQKEVEASQQARSEAARRDRDDHGDGDIDDDHNEDDDDDNDEPSRGPEYTRRGTCTIRTAYQEADGTMASDVVDEHAMPAVLDMKWSMALPPQGEETDPSNPLCTLGIANAQGYVTIHQLHLGSTASAYHLRPLSSLRINSRKALCLSLDWSDRSGGHHHGYPQPILARTQRSTDGSLIVSQSDGSLAYLPSIESAVQAGSIQDPLAQTRPSSVSGRDEGAEADDARVQGDAEEEDDYDRTSEDEREQERAAQHVQLNLDFAGKPRGLETWHAHDFEAWTAAFDCWSAGRTVWSGGDDLKLHGWDVRTAARATGRRATFTASRGFDGGVTALQSHHLRQHLWAVGSYDATLRLYDARAPLRPVCETAVGGGVWRVKWHPTEPDELLVGCMHDGVKVVRLASLASLEQGGSLARGEEIELVTRFDGHESLAYGCDWDRGLLPTGGKRAQSRRNVYSCSFYDAMLHIWQS